MPVQKDSRDESEFDVKIVKKSSLKKPNSEKNNSYKKKARRNDDVDS